MEVVFHFFKIFKIDLDSTRLDLPMLESKFCSFSAISLLDRWGGWGILELKLTQPQVELEAWAELNNKLLTVNI